MYIAPCMSCSHLSSLLRVVLAEPVDAAFAAAENPPPVQRVRNEDMLSAFPTGKLAVHRDGLYFLRMFPVQLFAMLGAKLHPAVRMISYSDDGTAFQTAEFTNYRSRSRSGGPDIVDAMTVGIPPAFGAAVFLNRSPRRKFFPANYTIHRFTPSLSRHTPSATCRIVNYQRTF